MEMKEMSYVFIVT